MGVTIYGIKTCDTVRKARSWLEGGNIEYRFHDFRVDGLDPKDLRRWSDALGWEKLLNRASSTFRALPDADKSDIDGKKALALMTVNPTIIKRPVLDVDGSLALGFKPDVYAQAIAKKAP